MVGSKLAHVDWARAIDDVAPFLDRSQDRNLLSSDVFKKLFVEKALQDLIAKGIPGPFRRHGAHLRYYALFLPELPPGKLSLPENGFVIDAKTILASLRNRE